MHRIALARVWLDLALAATTGALALLTVLWSEWIELVLRVDPDHGDGTVEWLVVALLAVASLASTHRARVGWRRAATGPAT